ncbi:MAG: hypothetical protein AAGJ74_05110 [Pseudomonadota bacterium]
MPEIFSGLAAAGIVFVAGQLWQRKVRLQREADARDRAQMMAALRWQPVNPDVPRLVSPRRVASAAPRAGERLSF